MNLRDNNVLYSYGGYAAGEARCELGMNTRKKVAPQEFDFGYREFVCNNCGFEFVVDWETIFAIQEATHGYVGYEYGDYYGECPKCERQYDLQNE